MARAILAATKEAGIALPEAAEVSEQPGEGLLEMVAGHRLQMPELEKKQLHFLDACLDADVVKAGAFDLTGLLAGLEAPVNVGVLKLNSAQRCGGVSAHSSRL